MTQKPLLLKDYLELDPFADSSSPDDDSFVSFPRKHRPPRDSITTVRHLLETEFSAGAKLVRSRSRNAVISKLSVVINAVKKFPLPSRARPNVARKFGRRFWRVKKVDGGGRNGVTVKDIVRLDSFESCGGERRSPVVSSCCSSCSEGEQGSQSFVSSSTSRSLEGFVRDSSGEKSPNHRGALPSEKQTKENQDVECGRCRSEEEKEQLSPLSIMDFPDEEEEEEDDEVTSPCFEQSLANIERTTHQLLQKIRRFESLAHLDPADLDLRFSSDDEGKGSDVASPDEVAARDMLRPLRLRHQVDPRYEKLLLDFFVEGLSLPAGAAERLVPTAGDWIDGRGCLKAEECGEDQLNEMERNGRWRSFGDGTDDVAADVEADVLASLIDELVLDLAMD